MRVSTCTMSTAQKNIRVKLVGGFSTSQPSITSGPLLLSEGSETQVNEPTYDDGSLCKQQSLSSSNSSSNNQIKPAASSAICLQSRMSLMEAQHRALDSRISECLDRQENIMVEMRKLYSRLSSLSHEGALRSDQVALANRIDADMQVLRGCFETQEESALLIRTNVDELLRFRATYEKFLSDLLSKEPDILCLLNTRQNMARDRDSRVLVDEFEVLERNARWAEQSLAVVNCQTPKQRRLATPSTASVPESEYQQVATPARSDRLNSWKDLDGRTCPSSWEMPVLAQKEQHFHRQEKQRTVSNNGARNAGCPTGNPTHGRPKANTPLKRTPRYNSVVRNIARLYRQLKRRMTTTRSEADHGELIREFFDGMPPEVSIWFQDQLATMFPGRAKRIPRRGLYNPRGIVPVGLSWKDIDRCMRSVDWTWLE